MNQRQIMVLFCLLLLFAGAVVFQKIQSRVQDKPQPYLDLGTQMSADSIGGVMLKKGDHEVLISKRQEGVWVLSDSHGASAQAWKVERLIDDLVNLKGELRAHSKDLFSNFGISDEEAFRITLTDKGDRLKETFLVGTQIARPSGTFFRKAESEEIYWVDQDLLSTIGVFGDTLDANFWMDLLLIRTESSAITQVQIVKNTKTGPVTAVDLNLSETVDTKVETFLNRLTGMRASRLVGVRNDTYGFEDFSYKLILGSTEGDEILVWGNPTDENESSYYVTRDNLVYEMAQFYVDQLDVDNDTFSESSSDDIENK